MKTNKVSFPSLSSEIEKINVQEEVDAIEAEILELFKKDTYQEIQDQPLVQRITNCIAQLEGLAIMYRSEQTLNSDVLSFLAERSEAGLEGAAAAVYEAQKLIFSSMNNLSKKKLRVQLRNCLIEGYAIINLVRAKFFGEIEYKVMAVGQYNGNDVILEANPSLVKILEAAHFDSTSMSLAIRQSQRTFERYSSQLSALEGELDEMDTMLGMMKKVQLSPQDQNVWAAFQRIQTELMALKAQNPELGVAMNYGNLTETFLQYQLEDKKLDVEMAYALLEKGRNNLAYYLGGDITDSGVDYQVKTLSAYGKVGRFDVATLSNVITPLKQVLSLMLTQPDDLQSSLQKFFTAEAGQGDRPFKKEAEEAVKNAIDKVLKEMGFVAK